MSRDEIRITSKWAAAIVAIGVAVSGAAAFAARSVAGDRVAPVEHRVGAVEARVDVLENDQKRQDAITDRVEKKLDGLDRKLDVLLQRTR
mgnify:FL=1